MATFDEQEQIVHSEVLIRKKRGILCCEKSCSNLKEMLSRVFFSDVHVLCFRQSVCLDVSSIFFSCDHFQVNLDLIKVRDACTFF